MNVRVHVTLVNVINVQNDALLPQCIFQLFEETIDVYIKAYLFQYWQRHFVCAPSCFLESWLLQNLFFYEKYENKIKKVGSYLKKTYIDPQMTIKTSSK